tara:strand:+ start:82 stop:291 length:210 start_codon:yes stop_codon:yes gene_type:complete
MGQSITILLPLTASLLGAFCAGYEAKNKRPVSAAVCAWVSALGLIFAAFIIFHGHDPMADRAVLMNSKG